MNILGIVAEYNPFHNGHLYHLQEAIKKTNPDVTVCVMSGNFIQRGEPALVNKFKRADMAIKNGIDLVIELPTYYALQTAEKFAYGAVKLLSECKVNNIAFGAESSELNKLQNIAHFLVDEPFSYSEELKRQLDTGISFPSARANAVSKIMNISSNILNKPNNILAIEYLKAIYSLNLDITPILIDRIDSGYFDTDSKTNILSATGIREKLLNNLDVDLFLPDNVIEKLENPVFFKDFEQILMYSLRKLTLDDIKDLPDVNEGLENRIFYAISTSTSIDEIIEKIKTKRYTLSRIKRILFYAMLNISKTNFNTFEKSGGVQYIRVLAANEKGKKLLSTISTSSLPLVTSVNKFLENANEIQKEMLLTDILATNIYSLVSNDKTMNLDYLRRL